jgi:hypothetical protein
MFALLNNIHKVALKALPEKILRTVHSSTLTFKLLTTKSLARVFSSQIDHDPKKGTN